MWATYKLKAPRSAREPAGFPLYMAPCASAASSITVSPWRFAIPLIRSMSAGLPIKWTGRIARVLTTLLLLQAGYAYVPYSSLERVVEDSKDEYYRSLRRAQATLDRGEAQLGDWILYFLRCLVKQKEVLERKLDRERLMEPMSPLSEELVGLVRDPRTVVIVGRC